MDTCALPLRLRQSVTCTHVCINQTSHKIILHVIARPLSTYRRLVKSGKIGADYLVNTPTIGLLITPTIGKHWAYELSIIDCENK